MIPIPKRRLGSELLDMPYEQEDNAEFEQGMADIRAVNSYFGGTKSILKHLPEIIGPDKELFVLDISAGTADIPAAIAKWARRGGLHPFIAAVDMNEKILRFAARHVGNTGEIRLVCADAFNLPFKEKTFDLVICSLTLHHFSEEEALELIIKARSLARQGIIIGDLRRSWASYFLFKAAAAIFFRNRFTRHDGPLSILRSYTPEELVGIAARAGLTDFKIHKHLFWRMTLVAKA